MPSPADARAKLNTPREHQAADVDRYFLIWRDRKLGTGVLEMNEDVSTNRAEIVALIATGQETGIDRIYRGNEALGIFANVTRDVADDVLQHCINEEIALSSDLRGWLHEHVGIRAVEDAIEEYPYLDDDYHAGWNR
jgi:hypothetical protein